MTLTDRNSVLASQVGSGEQLPMTYTGKDTLRITRIGIDIVFQVAEKKMVIKQEVSVQEFVKE